MMLKVTFLFSLIFVAISTTFHAVEEVHSTVIVKREAIPESEVEAESASGEPEANAEAENNIRLRSGLAESESEVESEAEDGASAEAEPTKRLRSEDASAEKVDVAHSEAEAESQSESEVESSKSEICDDMCLTNDGRAGRCTSFKQCYPYFKMFDISANRQWVMGSNDLCNSSTTSNNKVSGVCCPFKWEVPSYSKKESEPLLLNISSALMFSMDEDVPKIYQVEKSELGKAPGGSSTLYSSMHEKPLISSISACGKRYFQANATQLSRIVNGEQTRMNELPFMAAIMNGDSQFCGGSLVDEIHILTAAHCVLHFTNRDVRRMRVVLGNFNLKMALRSGKVSTENRQQIRQIHSVRRVIRHKDFSAHTLHNDIAVLTLKQRVRFSTAIQPICLNGDDKDILRRVEAIVAGWGSIAENEDSTHILRKVDVRIWDNTRCDKSYGDRSPGGIISSMMCASKPRERKDSCDGDSGGPLFICNEMCRQVGIVSWGIGCANPRFPGVYSRVSELLPWIKRILRKY